MLLKHFLLTWYGLTDLRASMGLDESEGPVLSALRTGDYSDVVILAYTNPAKQQHAFVGAVREEWEKWVTTPASKRSSLSGEHVNRFVDAVCNTESGHELFTEWLRRELRGQGVDVAIQLVPQALNHLNDASGIYAAASSAVRIAVEDPGENSVTTYVSPGTPVMAYTWALIARSNPQLKIDVISSSDPRKPPEHVELPKALLDSSIRAYGKPGHESGEYDLVMHLLGEQALPVVFGMRQFQAERHLILTTKEYEDEARRLATSAGIAATPVIIPDPFKPADTRKAIAKQVNKLPASAKVAVNMTGGTKLMFAGALSACWELGLDPFYFEIRNHNVIFLRDGTHVPFVGISDVEDFLRAGDFSTISDGRWPDEPESYRNLRLPAAQELWKQRDGLRDFYRSDDFARFSRQAKSPLAREQRDAQPFSFSWKGGEASAGEDGSTLLIVTGADIKVPRKGFFQFLAGGWLEEYVYSLLCPLEDDGVVRDVRVGFVAGYRQEPTSNQDKLAQEFDCTFTDGKRLWIVECKAGPVSQEAIQKLENNLRLYGGVAAKGIFVSSHPLTESNRNRLGKLPTITAVAPEELSTETLRRIVMRG